MFGSKAAMIGGPLRLEDARFSREDILALNNGYDNMYLTAPDHIMEMDDDVLIANLEKWRKRAVVRLRGTGLVDSEGKLSEDLASALTPLSAPGRAITDAEHDGKAGLFMCESGWTVLKKDPGFMGGWGIYPVDPEDGVDAALSFALGREEPKHSLWRGNGLITAEEGGQIVNAINAGGDEGEQVMRAIAFRRGLPKAAFVDLAHAIADAGVARSKMPKSFELYSCDCSDAEKYDGAPFKTPIVQSGYRRTSYAMVVPEKGFYLKQATTPRKGDDSFTLNGPLEQEDRTYFEAGLVKEGSVYEAATSVYEWYPDDAPTDAA